MRLRVESLASAPYRPTTLSATDLTAFAPTPTCPACGEATERRPAVAIGGRHLDEALRVVLCGACGHAGYDRLPSEAWLATFYGRVWDTPGRASGFDRPAKVTAAQWAAIALNVSRHARILDFGCGFGDAMRGFRDAGFDRLYGVEPGDHRVRVAGGHFPGGVRQGSLDAARALAAESGPFDVIVSQHVLEHVREPGALVRDLAALLAPGGVFIGVVPDFYAESPVLTALYLPHLHLFNRVSLAAAMRGAGLSPYRWPHSPGELVVAAGRGAWRPLATEHFHDIPARVDEDELKRMLEYLTNPWHDVEAGRTTYLAYFQVAYGRTGFTTYPAGYHRLESDLGVRAYAALQRSGVLARVTGRRGVGGLTWRALRALNGARTAELRRVLAVTGLAPSELPWLTGADGSTVVLSK